MKQTNYIVYVNNHRFTPIVNATRELGWEIQKIELIPKGMIWRSNEMTICWEYHDGIRIDDGQENIERLRLFIERVKPPFVYVKPNWSDTQSAEIAKLAAQHGIKIITCAPWSYYPSSFWLHANRSVLRQDRRKIERRLAFFGSVWNDHRIRSLSAMNDLVDCPTLNLKNPAEYVKELQHTQCTYQPAGCGVRHQLYESMCLGIPSIVEESTYLHSFIRKLVLEVPSIPTQADKERIEQYIDDSTVLRDELINAYETRMTPKAIVSEVLNKLSESV